MAKGDQKRVFGSLPLLAALAFIAGGTLLTHLPLRSVRPQPPEGLELVQTDPHLVEARLWQDPFRVAQEHARTEREQADSTRPSPVSRRRLRRIWELLAQEPAASPDESDPFFPHGVSQISNLIREWQDEGRDGNDVPPAVQILTITVRDGDAAEDYERRLRNRYAVLTALNAAGMEPDDVRHIRYFMLGEGTERHSASRPMIVPFETFTREKLHPKPNEVANEKCPEHLIVVWLPESALAKQPMHTLARLLHLYLGPEGDDSCLEQLVGTRATVRLDVIGPSSSTTLQAMLADVPALPQPGPDPNCPLHYVTLFSPWSTASPVLLTPRLASGAKDSPGTCRTIASVETLGNLLDLVTSRFKAAGINFVRMIGTDDLLALHLIEELRRRQIDVLGQGKNHAGAAHVALISEWDTFYGKAFPLTFAAMVDCLDPNGAPLDWKRYAQHLDGMVSGAEPNGLPNVHSYHYVSGIDGLLPETERMSDSGESEKPEGTESLWQHKESLEVPTGRGQLDYARRLAVKLRAHYRRHPSQKLQAIGVVGSDVYDKLTLLHALREEFGDITLFTTDLDARLLHHEQTDWTRNLIVASSYGLELAASYQCHAYKQVERRTGGEGQDGAPSPFAPFRDNYQVSLFLACRAALGLRATIRNGRFAFRWLHGDLLAEALGRPRLFEIGRGQAVDLSVTGKKPTVHLHPERANPGAVGWFWQRFWLLLSLGVGVAALWPVLGGVIPLFSPLEARPCAAVTTLGAYWEKHRRFSIVVGAVAFALASAIIRDHYDPEGEPFSLTAGTSAWPGILLFVLAMVLGLSFVRRVRHMLRGHDEAIAQDFVLPTKYRAEGSLMRRIGAHVGRVISSVCHPLRAWRRESRGPADTANVKALWEAHILQWRFSERVFWPCAWFGLLCLLLLGLVRALGLPHQPCRGALCYTTYRIAVTACCLSLLWLLILIAGETRRRFHMINAIIDERTVWPAALLENKEQAGSADRLDVHFVARITKAAGKLVYFPSVILLLLMAARLPYFDNWGFPPLLFIVYAMPIAYILSLMATLQLAARRARATALYHVQQEIKAIDSKAEERAKQRKDLERQRSAEQSEGIDQETPAEEKRRKRIELARLKEEINLLESDDKAQKEERERLEGMMTEIEELREGAFRPFAENPIVHALLIPSGGAGLLAVLTYLLPS